MSGSFLRRLASWLRGTNNRVPLDERDPASNKKDDLAGLLADDDLSWLNPPQDIHFTEAWDRYWRDQINHGLGPGLFDMFCDEERLISAMRRRGFTTILCAGNGISQEPRALAAAGFKVTALDTSPVATQIAQAVEFGPDALVRYYPQAHRDAGGSVEFVVGDLRDESLCPGPFDVVIERRTLQLFPPGERGPALDALAHRLRPDGIFLSHCHCGTHPDAHNPLEDLFAEKGWAIECAYEDLRSEGRVAWLSQSTG